MLLATSQLIFEASIEFIEKILYFLQIYLKRINAIVIISVDFFTGNSGTELWSSINDFLEPLVNLPTV